MLWESWESSLVEGIFILSFVRHGECHLSVHLIFIRLQRTFEIQGIMLKLGIQQWQRKMWPCPCGTYKVWGETNIKPAIIPRVGGREKLPVCRTYWGRGLGARECLLEHSAEGWGVVRLKEHRGEITNHFGSHVVKGGLPPASGEISGSESSDLSFKKVHQGCCAGAGLEEASREGCPVGRLAPGRVQSDGGLDESGAMLQRRGQMDGEIYSGSNREWAPPIHSPPFLIAFNVKGLVPSFHARDRQVAIFPSLAMRGDPCFSLTPLPPARTSNQERGRSWSCGCSSYCDSSTPAMKGCT